jgi:hypothetical protein
MSTAALTVGSTGPATVWAGRALTALPVLFLTFDSVIKLVGHQQVALAFGKLQFPMSAAAPIGWIELLGVALYVVPRTSVLGAVLLTAHLGGAVASHVRVGDPLFSHVLFPVYVGAMLWAGLFLRDGRVRALLG